MSTLSLTPESSVLPTASDLYTRWQEVTVSHLDEGKPLKLTFVLVLTLRGGGTKHVTKAVVVTDALLIERIRKTVKPGDALRVHLETDWSADDLPTTLTDFCLI